MNTQTGEVISPATFASLSPEIQKQFVRVKRDMTAKEATEMQIRLYSPCVCGSGKKFKFCCKT